MNGWHKKGRKEVCLFNGDNAACRFGSTIAFVGFLAAMAFLAIEAVFQNLSSIKVRRRVVMGDVAFSGEHSLHQSKYLHLAVLRRMGSALSHHIRLSGHCLGQG